MGVQITIRDVPESVRDELASRAASEGCSMQEYLHRSLVSMVTSQSNSERWLDQVRQRKQRLKSVIKSEDIIEARGLDRR